VNVVPVGDPDGAEWVLIDTGMPKCGKEIEAVACRRFGDGNKPMAIIVLTVILIMVETYIADHRGECARHRRVRDWFSPHSANTTLNLLEPQPVLRVRTLTTQKSLPFLKGSFRGEWGITFTSFR